MSDELSGLRKPRRSRTLGCLGCGCGAPILGVGLLAFFYSFNNRPPDIVVPTHSVPADNAYDDFVRVGRMLIAIPHKAPASMTTVPPESQMLAICKACSRDAAPALAILRPALDKRYMAPPVRIDNGTSFTSFPLFRETAREISGDAEFHARSGRPGKAANSLQDGMEMGVMIPRGGGVIHSLVSGACISIAAHQLEPLLRRLSPSELIHVAARLDRITAKRVPYYDIAEEEANSNTAMYLDEMGKIKSMQESYDFLREAVGIQAGSRPSLQEGVQMVRLALANKSRLLKDYRAYFMAVARESKGPYIGRSNVKLPSDLVEILTGGTDPTMSRRSYVANDAMLAVLRTEVALYLYRFDHGRYPDRLNQLAPNYIKTVPEDPCGGADGVPLKYLVKPSGKAFLLYSLGPDLIDNHGTPSNHPTARAGDIVAGQMWRKRKPGQ